MLVSTTNGRVESRVLIKTISKEFIKISLLFIFLPCVLVGCANAQINDSLTDKGGHREKAIELVRSAINEVEKGIAYDRQN